MHAHPGALAIPAVCSGATYPVWGKAEVDCNSCFHLVDGQRPRPTHSKGTGPKIRFGGGTYGLISQTKYWCWSVPLLIDPGDEQRYLGQQVRRGRKTLLTLENCGELDSLMRSGFSRSIGKTDNTQRECPRSSAIRTTGLTRSVEETITKGLP